jgi:histone deacetylase complex regulatory component SIN3
MLLGSWVLVQVPAKDVRLDDPGSNLPPIGRFKQVTTFDSAGACEAYRDVALQDGAYTGSDAMMDQSSQLRCVPAEQLTPRAATPAPN